MEPVVYAMPSNCASNNATPYVVHHAIPPYYTDLATCQTNDVPLDPNAVPPITAGYTFITPSNEHNAHSGSLTVADQWLQTGRKLGRGGGCSPLEFWS